jgi:hypothetical protein
MVNVYRRHKKLRLQRYVVRTVSQAFILCSELIALHSQTLDLTVTAATRFPAVLRPGTDARKKAGYKNSNRKRRQKRQYPRQKSAITHCSPLKTSVIDYVSRAVSVSPDL